MEPITTELRKLMTHTVDGFDLHRPLVECDRETFERLCDNIDAVHDGLERENGRLKCELDRVLGELDDMHKTDEVSNKTTTFMHSGKRSIGSAFITITPTLDWSAMADELRAIVATLDGGAE